MSRTQRIVMLGIALLILVVAIVVLGRGSSKSTSASAGPTTIVVKGAHPVGGVKDITYKRGKTIDLTIQSDVADEIHFHGYDVHEDVARNGSAHFKLPASIAGKFVVELEGHKQALATIVVEP
jgi:hypothetical protein